MDDKLFAFVLMPFSSEFDDVYRLGIKAAVEENHMKAERVDEQFYSESMLDRIYSQITSCDVVIADMSEKNPNVFYEVGYAHAKNKSCILLTSDAQDIPFDLKHRRHIVYGSSIVKLKSALSKDLKAITNEIRSQRVPITIEIVRTIGDLEKTSYCAKGLVSFYIDLHNKSLSQSPELDLMYMYTGRGWTFTQDGHECLNAKSDIPGFQTRHIIKPPIRRLNSGGWAQVKVQGKKILAYGDKKAFEDSYKISGRVLIRAITSERTFDFPIKIEVTCEDFPF